MQCFVRKIAVFILASTMLDSSISGKVLAVFGAICAVGNMAGSSLYNVLYPLTLQYWPGTCFAIGACISILPMCLVW